MYVLLIYSIIHVNKHVALRPQKRDGLLGTGNVGVWLDRALRPGKTEVAVDHRQNNYVEAVGASPLRSN